jgi:hypothetical protein
MSGNVVIKMSVQRMVCTGCGSEANASCNCGLAYLPKEDRARKLAEENPSISTRALSKLAGVGVATAHRAKQGVPNGTGEVVGLDGNTYPARRPRPMNAEEYDDETGEVLDSEHEQGLRVIAARGFINRAVEAKNICTIEKLHASDVTEAMVEAAYDAAAAWGEAARNLREMLSHG